MQEVIAIHSSQIASYRAEACILNGPIEPIP